MLGLTVEEFVPFMPEQTNTVDLDGPETSCSLWADVIQLEGAQELGTFNQDFYAGKPALTRNQFSKGSAYYLGTQFPMETMQLIFNQILADAGVTPVLNNIPAGVEVVLRQNGSRSYLCVLNHLPETVSVDLQEYRGSDLLTGEGCEAQISLEPYGVRIVEM
jgi:beta-galactosidase